MRGDIYLVVAKSTTAARGMVGNIRRAVASYPGQRHDAARTVITCLAWFITLSDAVRITTANIAAGVRYPFWFATRRRRCHD